MSSCGKDLISNSRKKNPEKHPALKLLAKLLHESVGVAVFMVLCFRPLHSLGPWFPTRDDSLGQDLALLLEEQAVLASALRRSETSFIRKSPISFIYIYIFLNCKLFCFFQIWGARKGGVGIGQGGLFKRLFDHRQLRWPGRLPSARSSHFESRGMQLQGLQAV